MNLLRLFFSSLLLFAGMLQAQSSDTSPIVLHSDKPFYVTGEVIWYQLYLPPAYQGRDLALKMVLVQPDGAVVDNYFLKTAGSTTADGYFKLPYDLNSGMYHLLVLGTATNTRKKVKLAEAFLPIYNDLSGEEQKPGPAGRPAMTKVAAGDLQVSVQLKAGPFQKRSEIGAVIQVTDRAGNPIAANISVAVTDAGLSGSGMQAINPAGRAAAAPAGMSAELIFQGAISGEQGKARPETTIGVLAVDEQNSYLTTSGANGELTLTLPDFTGNRTIQFVDLRADSLHVSLDDGIELAPAPALPFTEEIKEYLKWSRSRKMIYQLYNSVEANLQIENPVPTAKQFKPDHRVVFREYASFPDFFTFFTEVSTPLKIRLDKDRGYFAKMFNPDPRMRAFYQGEPIFIVDGKMTRDVNFIQNLPMEKLDTLDEFFDFTSLSSNFGKLGSNGIAVLRTSIPNLELPAPDEARVFNVHGLLPEARLILPENPGPQQPVFRSQIYWLAGETTNGAGNLPLKFPQSDDLGTFRIEVVAQSKDGKIGYGVQEYKVEW